MWGIDKVKYKGLKIQPGDPCACGGIFCLNGLLSYNAAVYKIVVCADCGQACCAKCGGQAFTNNEGKYYCSCKWKALGEAELRAMGVVLAWDW